MVIVMVMPSRDISSMYSTYLPVFIDLQLKTQKDTHPSTSALICKVHFGKVRHAGFVISYRFP